MVFSRLREFLSPRRLSTSTRNIVTPDITSPSSPTARRESTSQSPDSVTVTVHNQSRVCSRQSGRFKSKNINSLNHHSSNYLVEKESVLGIESSLTTTDLTPSKSVENEDFKRNHRHHFKFRRHSRDSNHSLSTAKQRIVAVFHGSNQPRNRDSAITIATGELSIPEEDKDSLSETSSPAIPIPNHLKTTITSMPLLAEITMASSSPLRESLNSDITVTNSSPTSGSVKTRIIQPKIAALVEKFEEDLSSYDAMKKENQPFESYKATDDCIFDDESLFNTQNVQNSSNDTLKPLLSNNVSGLRRFASVHSLSPSYSHGTAGAIGKAHTKLKLDFELVTTAHDSHELKQASSASPLKVTTNILRSMPSIVDLVPFRRRDSHRESNGRAQKTSTISRPCIDEEQLRDWETKIRAIAAWVNHTLVTGHMEEFPMNLLGDITDHGRDSGSDDLEDTIVNNELRVLSAEQDLAECFQSGAGQFHVAGYAVHLLQEALEIQKRNNVERIPWAQEAALFLIHHPDRLPLGIRIQAVHLLVELNWFESTFEELLIMAWKWCHQLQATKFMTEWKTKTLSLWAEKVGDLANLPDLQVKPPIEGYCMRVLTVKA